MNSQQTLKSSGSNLTTPSSKADACLESVEQTTQPTRPLIVLVIDEDTKRAHLVEEGLESNAIVHIVSKTHGRPLLELIADISPDVIIMDCNSPDRDTIESLRQVAQSNPKPIVMFVEEDNPTHMQEAIQAGVSAYVVDGLTPKRVRPLIDTAIARFKVMDDLKSELQKTKDDLAARKLIAKAKGILMEQQGMTEEQAFKAMRDMSQQRSKPMKDIAENIISIFDLIARNNAEDQ